MAKIEILKWNLRVPNLNEFPLELFFYWIAKG